MAKNQTKKFKKTKKGGGKFLLGTILGAIAGLVAGRLTAEDQPLKTCSATPPKPTSKRPLKSISKTPSKKTIKK